MKRLLPTRLVIGMVKGNRRRKDIDMHRASYIIEAPSHRLITITLSDHGGWDHMQVSVTHNNYANPHQEEIDFACELVFESEETVVEFHQPKPEKINNHVIRHLWRRHLDNEDEVPSLELW